MGKILIINLNVTSFIWGANGSGPLCRERDGQSKGSEVHVTATLTFFGDVPPT